MKLIDKISPQKLKDLYWHQKMSSPEVAKIYRCNQTTIRRRLKKYGIKIRNMSEAMKIYKRVEISKEELRKLYLKEKVTTSEIAKNFNCCQRTILNKLLEYHIPIRTISEASVFIKPRYPRKNFGGNLEEKAYLIGFRLGDLNVYSQSKISPTIYVRASSTKPKFLSLVKSLFLSYGQVWYKLNKGQFNIKCYLNRSFDFLLPKKDLIESWILKNKNCFASFLAGYIDAEGSFYLRSQAKSSGFSILSEDKNILSQIYFKLIELNILCMPSRLARKKGTIYGKTINNKDEWSFSMGRKDSLLKLIKLINPYLKHTERRKNMEAVKKNVLARYEKYGIYQSSRWHKLYLKLNSKSCQVIPTGHQ